MRTHVRLLAHVNALAYAHGCKSRELFLADGALERFDALVDGANMLVQ